MRSGTFKIEYNVDMMTLDKRTRKVKDKSSIKNTIVNSGLEILAKLLGGITTTSFSAIAIGTDNTTATSSDTALGSEYTRASADIAYEADYKAVFSYEFSFTESTTIYEVGIFDNAVSGGNMLNHAIDAGKAVDSDTSLTVDVTITCAEA